jgi:SAM-dependent methyltransferase
VAFTKICAAFNTFAAPDEFWAWYLARRERSRACEAWIEQHEEVLGYCDCCGEVVPLRVRVGAMFGTHPSLREGLICPQGLSGRARLMFRILKDTNGGAVEQPIDLILYEDFTALRRAISTLPGIRSHTSLYNDTATQSGAVIIGSRGDTTHQDITASSYAGATADIVVHCDVLEHIPRYRAALKDNLRILKPGGVLLFTVPFFVQQRETQVLAHTDGEGRIFHHIPEPEYHADPGRGEILTYYRFGWSLLDELRGIGFVDARILVEFDIFAGLTSNNNPYMEVGNMPPLAIVAVK